MPDSWPNFWIRGSILVTGLANVDLERLLNRHKDAVYRQMVRTCGNHDDAEDALAEALFTALKVSDQLRDPGNFRAWLSKIGTRACARVRIRERLLKFTSISDLEGRGIDLTDSRRGPVKEAELSNLKSCIVGALELLPEIYRQVYIRREVMGETAEEIANDLKLSLPAVKSRLLRARAMMRDHLDSGLGCKGLV